VVGIHVEFPELKLLGCKELVETLREGDFVNQPIGTGCLGDILHAVRIQNVAHHRVTIPLFAAGELDQVGFGECFRIGHGRSPLLAGRAIAASWGKRDRGPLDEGSNAARQRAAMRGGAAQARRVRKRAALIPRRDRSQSPHERPSARTA